MVFKVLKPFKVSGELYQKDDMVILAMNEKVVPILKGSFIQRFDRPVIRKIQYHDNSVTICENKEEKEYLKAVNTDGVIYTKDEFRRINSFAPEDWTFINEVKKVFPDSSIEYVHKVKEEANFVCPGVSIACRFPSWKVHTGTGELEKYCKAQKQWCELSGGSVPFKAVERTDIEIKDKAIARQEMLKTVNAYYKEKKRQKNRKGKEVI